MTKITKRIRAAHVRRLTVHAQGLDAIAARLRRYGLDGIALTVEGAAMGIRAAREELQREEES